MVNEASEFSVVNLRYFKRGIKMKSRIWAAILVVMLVISFSGCEAFVRKFTRKKKEEVKEVVVSPEEYPDNPYTPQENYRQHFTFWKLWQDEVISNLNAKANHKRLMSSVNEALKNLTAMQSLLREEQSGEMLKYVQETQSLRNNIAGDIYCSQADRHRSDAESIKRAVFRYFGFDKIKDYIKK